MKPLNHLQTGQLKNVIYGLFMLLFLFTITQTAKASHVAGAEMTYTCTGTPGVYNLTLKIYRDCAGIQLCANCPSSLSPSCSLSVNITGVGSTCNGTSYGTATLNVITSISAFDVIQLCASASPTICNNCGTRTPGTFTPGIEAYTFTGTLNLTQLTHNNLQVSYNQFFMISSSMYGVTHIFL